MPGLRPGERDGIRLCGERSREWGPPPARRPAWPIGSWPKSRRRRRRRGPFMGRSGANPGRRRGNAAVLAATVAAGITIALASVDRGLKAATACPSSCTLPASSGAAATLETAVDARGAQSWPWPRRPRRRGTWRVRPRNRPPGSAARCSTRPPRPSEDRAKPAWYRPRVDRRDGLGPLAGFACSRRGRCGSHAATGRRSPRHRSTPSVRYGPPRVRIFARDACRQARCAQ